MLKYNYLIKYNNKLFIMNQTFLNHIKISVFCSIFLSFSVIAQTVTDTVAFIHITDTHICNLHPYNTTLQNKRKHIGEGFRPFTNFLDSVPRYIKSDFIVITGDMVDLYDGESLTGNMLDTQVEQFVKLLDNSHVPVYMTLGNHDIFSYWVTSDSTYVERQFNAGEARAAWIRNASCFKNGTYYSRILKVGTTTYRLIFLDNSYYSPTRNEDKIPYVVDQTQLFWLDNELKASDNDVELIFMHIPLLNGLVDQENPVLEVNKLDYAGGLFDILGKNRSVRIIFAGHKHRHLIYEYKFSDTYSLINVETGCFGRLTESKKWRLIKLTADKVIISNPGEQTDEFVLNVDN